MAASISSVTKVLVIGATGLLGREVVLQAQARGDDVLRAGRLARPGWLRFDALRDDPAELFAHAEVEFVVNCAAVLASEIEEHANGATAEIVNAQFPHALAAAAETLGARLVQISTDAVFAADSGRCVETDVPVPSELYGRTKLAGEPARENTLTLRCSFVGLDPERQRGLLEWLLSQPSGAQVDGFLDHAWNGLASTQVAAVCAALADPGLFGRVRAEGGVHHLFEDPVISKHELLTECARRFETAVSVIPRESGSPVTRTLGTAHVTLAECLQCVPPRAQSLELLADRRKNERG
jgi:dTDP-4-dehydrorhamnose reductase